ncbi:PH domain-containing protein [Anaerobacillus sp. MEB173]|uniref:PH domain-containing protein n=1 Tax=Anaerobacillus sp. MEB173 TaxID=3383345 RepID=UPI003F8F8B9C
MSRRRLHPAAIAVSFIIGLREMLIPLVVLIFFGRGGEGHSFFSIQYIMLAILGVMIISGLLKWISFTYEVSHGELKIRQGIFVKKKRFIRQERIQSIDISAGIIQRLFKLVQVRVETAGGGKEPEVKLIAVTKENARQLRQILLTKELESNHDTTVENTDRKDTVFWQLPRKDLFIAALTSSGIGLAISAVGALYSQVEQFFPDSFYEDTFGAIIGTSIMSIVFLIIVIIFIAWMFSILITMLKYGNFSISKTGDELVISRGILEQRQLTLSLKRVTGLRIVRNVFRQPLGFAAIYVESAGGGSKEEQLSTVLFPIIRNHDISSTLQQIAPEFAMDIQVNPVPKRALARYLLRVLVPAIALISIISYMIPYGAFSLLLLPFIFLWGYLQYRDAGYGERENYMWLRFRTISQTVVIIPKKAIQASEFRQVLFQKRRNLATFSVAILSSISGKKFQVKDVDVKEAGNLLDVVRKS